MTLRTQLLLVALVVLILPVAGWQLVRVMEAMLRAGQEEAVLARTEALARALEADFLDLPAPDAPEVLYVRPIGYPVNVDGYAADWDIWLPWSQPFGGLDPNHAPVRITLARHERQLFGLLRVRDPSRDYFTPERGVAGSDHVRFTLAGPGGQETLAVTTAAPGSVEAGAGAWRLRGEWQESPQGYVLEFRLPAASASEGLGFAVVDARDGSGARLLAATGPDAAPLQLVGPTPARERRLAALATDGTKLWLLDARGWVLARGGSLYRESYEERESGTGRVSSALYRWLLAPPLDPPRPRPDIAARLDGPEIQAARRGKSALRWVAAPGENTVLASAAMPVRDAEGRVAGALVMERRTDALLAFTNSAVFRLLWLTLVAFGAVALVLLAYATVLSLRIRRLRDAAERSLAPDGRLRGDFPTPQARDEVGDLGRSFASLLAELREHTDYLRTLADKLSHELRTPIAMVRSSLDNLEQEPLDGNARRYAERARDGAERLSAIVRAMAEASRIEQSIRDAAAERFDLGGLLEAQLAAWREFRDDRRFELKLPGQPCPVHASPELVSRLLDKLIENAVDFTPQGGMIELSVKARRNGYLLSVFNEGSRVPDSPGRLFDSMTSRRERKGESPHLGLGLYVARLIAEHHGGRIAARNVADGVVFDVVLGRGAE